MNEGETRGNTTVAHVLGYRNPSSLLLLSPFACGVVVLVVVVWECVMCEKRSFGGYRIDGLCVCVCVCVCIFFFFRNVVAKTIGRMTHLFIMHT